MATESFHQAKRNKNDEFYTQYNDISKEIENYVKYNSDVFRNKTIILPCDDFEKSNFTKYFIENFNRLGLKKLISTSVAPDYVLRDYSFQTDLFADDYVDVDKKSFTGRGKLFVMTGKDDNIPEGTFLKGNGDFRSKEVSDLMKESDFIITNPPFSLFREFMEWIFKENKLFLIISNMNALTYKEIYPRIKDNLIWMGIGFGREFQGFIVPDDYPLVGSEARIDELGNRIVSTNNTIWLTNIEHGRRHQLLSLKTMADNLSMSKHAKLKGKLEYDRYDNMNAIEVPFTDSIPADYKGVMGVPISFLHWYSPDQFVIVGFRKGNDGRDLRVNGKSKYFRVLIKFKK